MARGGDRAVEVNGQRRDRDRGRRGGAVVQPVVTHEVDRLTGHVHRTGGVVVLHLPQGRLVVGQSRGARERQHAGATVVAGGDAGGGTAHAQHVAGRRADQGGRDAGQGRALPCRDRGHEL